LNVKTILLPVVFLVLSICFPSYTLSKDHTVNYSNPFTFPSDEANDLLQSLREPGSVISLLEGGGVPVGLNTNTTLQLDLLNETQKADLLAKVKQPNIYFRCIGENQSVPALQNVYPDAKYSTITIKAINFGKCIATDSSSEHFQHVESNRFDLLIGYLKNASEAKIENLLNKKE
jgi:hypothetical protein